jgi:hypothetical protein
VKLVAGLAALMFAILAVGYWVWRTAPEPAPCAVRVLRELRSPDGRALAEAFESRCEGSLTTHVTLRASSAPTPARSDVFVAEGSAPVELDWAGGALRIACPARPVVRETSWRGVRVEIR